MYLSEVMPSRLLIQAVLVTHDVIIEVAAITQLQDEIEFRLRIDNLVETDDVRMLDQFHAANFLEEMRSWDFIEFRLVDHFHGHFFASEDMPG